MMTMVLYVNTMQVLPWLPHNIIFLCGVFKTASFVVLEILYNSVVCVLT